MRPLSVAMLMLFAVVSGAENDAAKAPPFSVKLALKNGHLREVFMAASTDATQGFDPRLDIPAPPPAIETGYTAFIVGESEFPLYKDFRPLGDVMEWKFMAKVHPNKPVTISWESELLPADYAFAVRLNDTVVDMRKVNSLIVEKTARLLFTATKAMLEKPHGP